MPDLQKFPGWFPEHNFCENYNFQKLHYNNRMLYQDWVGQLVRGKTWFHFNTSWPRSGRGQHIIANFMPNDADTYVFSNHFENWDHSWLDQFCVEHPNQQIIAIGEYPVLPKHKNLKTLVYSCQHLLIPDILKNFQNNYKFNSSRKYRLSSLCNKPSLTKIFSTAYLLKNFYPKDDLLLSWNKNLNKEICGSVDYVNKINHSDIINNLAEYYQTSMKEKVISYDDFNPGPCDVWNFDNVAYGDCVVNLTNETFAQSQRNEEIIPGPYLSEKSWKPMLGGTGLIPVGQPGVYTYFKNLGFNVDYPWPCEFDNILGDFDRLVELFKTIDWVFSNDYLDNFSKIMYINKHNYEHIRSDKFVKLLTHKNQQNLDNFFKNY
jgi:hypothetical protein